MKKRSNTVVMVFAYAISFIKGLLVTGKYLLKPAVTLQYPRQRWTPPARFRGRVTLRPKKCISCMMCARICPNYSIDVKFNVGTDKKRSLDKYTYRLDTCLFCGLCIEQCPTAAIFMNHGYEFAAYDRKKLVMELTKVDAHVE